MRGNGRYAATGRRTVTKIMFKVRIFNTAAQKKFELVYIPECKNPPKPVAEPPVLQKLRQSLNGNPPREESLEIQKAEKIPETLKRFTKCRVRTWDSSQMGFSFLEMEIIWVGSMVSMYGTQRVGFAANFGKENT